MTLLKPSLPATLYHAIIIGSACLFQECQGDFGAAAGLQGAVFRGTEDRGGCVEGRGSRGEGAGGAAR